MDLFDAEARLLNHIHRGNVGKGSHAATVIARAEGTANDLASLVRERLVRVHFNNVDVDPDAIEADPGMLAAFPIHTLPTSAGARWVRENPGNSVLTYLANTGSGHATLLELKRHTRCEDADHNLLVRLVDDGLIEVRDEAGRDIRRIRLRLAYSDRWLIHVTRAGRRRAGQN
jgi:hypothetical protein